MQTVSVVNPVCRAVRQLKWRHGIPRFLSVSTVAGMVIILLPYQASGSALICDQVAHQVSRESGVPVQVLMAITRTETGRTKAGETRPWPWTVNMEGKGFWFDTEDEARSYVFRHFKRGARSFDVGCFQINYKWHGQAFRSIDEMFDPLANARYAARFLKTLHAEKGNWSDAAGAYHSRTKTYADRYKTRFDRYHARLVKNPPSTPPITPEAGSVRTGSKARRANGFPLLKSGSGAPQLGSLVPATEGGRALIDRVSG